MVALLTSMVARAGLAVRYADVGALGGVESAWLPLAKVLDVKAWEPNGQIVKDLRIASRSYQGLVPRKHERYELFHAGVGAKPGVATLLKTAVPGLSSVLSPRQNLALQSGNYGAEGWKIVEEERVRIVSLDSEIRSGKIQPFDFLKVDTEGYDLEVLIGYSQNIHKSKFVQIEVNFESVREGDARFFDVDSLLRSYGFRLLELKPLSPASLPVAVTFPHGVGGFLITGEALYVRDIFSQNSGQELLSREDLLLWAILLIQLGHSNLLTAVASSMLGRGGQAKLDFCGGYKS